MSKEKEIPVKKKSRFAEGERVLCFHGPLLYDAKCLKVRQTNGSHEYFIHYAGWNKSWDEWVSELRVLKYNEQSTTKQRELSIAYKDAKRIRCKKNLSSEAISQLPSQNANSDNLCSYQYIDLEDDGISSNSGSADKPKQNSNDHSSEGSNDSGSSVSRKRKKIEVDPGVETEEQFMEKVEIKVKIPDELKPWLVDDWDLICKQKKLVHLPSKTIVDNIIDNYIKMKTPKNPPGPGLLKESAAVQVANGIKEYFNATIGSQLLYKFERVQYARVLEEFPGQPMSSVYGAAHLLRLFTVLGSMLVYTHINEKTVPVLKTQLQDFLKYLVKHSSTLFSTDDYDHATPEYLRLSEC